MISIEKAILADVCLGIPLGYITLENPAHMDLDEDLVGKYPKTYLFRGEQLALMKSLYNKKEGSIYKAILALIQQAEDVMVNTPPSVIDKPDSRFGTSHNDYQSLAKYAWPDPGAQGLSYKICDGEVNPDCYSDDFDYVRLVRFTETTVLLALAAYLSGDLKYSSLGAKYCKV
jgi:hypothetical protein